MKHNLKYLVEDVDRHGNVRVYVRRPGIRKIRLLEAPGTAAFLREYTAALTIVEPAGKVTRLGFVKDGSLQATCNAYFASSEFGALDISTRRWRRRALDVVCAAFGEVPIKDIRHEHVVTLRDQLRAQPGAARNRLKALKALFKWAVEARHLSFDPTRDVRVIKHVTNGHHAWTRADILAYADRHPIGTKARLAMELWLHTTCRREDVPRLGPSNIRGGRLRYVQGKNEHRKPVEIDMAIPEPLQRALDASAPFGETFLTTAFGKPFTTAGIGQRMREWCDEAGLPHCSAHGLRKAGAAAMAESGATAHEIGAITGHSSLEELERYTRSANKPRLADGATAKRYKTVPLDSPTASKDKNSPLAGLDMALPRGVKPP